MDDQLQLFVIPEGPADLAVPSNAMDSLAIGTAAEMLLVAELLKRGNKVALPVVDDDGVDLIVNYRLAVQVKSRTQGTSKKNPISISLAFREHVDVLAIYLADIHAWWHVPRDEILMWAPGACR